MPTAQSSTSSSSKSQADNKSMKGAKITNKQSNEIEQEQTSSAMTSGGSKTPTEQPEFIKQALIIIEKKVRNLDKRRQKLEEYKESQRKGAVLNEDQLLAVSKYEEVIKSLELSRELEKQFVGLANDAMKQQKKQAKKEQMEREEQIKDKLKETHRYLSALDTFADETIRNDFLNEVNGATKLTDDELKILDDFNKLVEPVLPNAKLDIASSEFADHFAFLIEGKNKPIAALTSASITYLDLKKIFDKIFSSAYWTQEQAQPEQQLSESSTTTQETNPIDLLNNKQEVTEQIELEQHNLVTAVENLELNNVHTEHFVDQQQQQQSSQIEQGIYSHQNTSDDFVIVSSNECNEGLDQSKSPCQIQQSEYIQTDGQTQKKNIFHHTKSIR